MVSLVNSARRAAGNSTLGWLNPALYALYPAFVNDVTSGDNKCLTSGIPCCSEGFTATTGWDPVTGLGSIDFNKFLHTFTNLSAPVPSPPVFSASSQWLVLEGNEEAGCKTKPEEVRAMSGFPTNRCLVQYDNASNPVSSVRYTCGGYPSKASIIFMFLTSTLTLRDDILTTYVCLFLLLFQLTPIPGTSRT